uniref:Polyhomeotic homolog 1 n=1 Tax=Neogobius melanostomus TaxID=47308 RepID=A0A8C6TSH8_9GOBI
METDGDQQRASTNGSAASGASSRPSAMNSMSLYERQAVQALQALQRQPNAAQYFQQLMLQQQINSAQLQNLAAVQQVKLLSVTSCFAPNPKAVGVKTEAPDKTPFSLVQPSHQSTPQSPSKPTLPQSHIKIPTYPAPSSLKAQPASSSSGSIPLSQLLLHGPRTLTSSAPTAAHILVQTSSSQTHGYQVGTATIKPGMNAQTLVVQPLQKSSAGSDKSGNGPVPIQPKTTLQGLRLPLQLPSRNPPPILPAPPATTTTTTSSSAAAANSSQTPHIPVQIVGARPSTLGNTQALALARNNCGQEGAPPVLSGSSSLLTMVASIASRESAAGSRGAGLKALQSQSEAAPQVSQVHPRTNQSAGQNGHVNPSPALPPSRLTPSHLHHGQSPSGEPATSLHTVILISLPLPSLRVARPRPLRVPGAVGVPRLWSDGARPPPQAVVKPNVLTHLIEGFVIQEGAEPFPVCGPVKDSSGEELVNDVLKCEYCKNFAPESQFRGTKRFCSMSCAKRYFITTYHSVCSKRGSREEPARKSPVQRSQDGPRKTRLNTHTVCPGTSLPKDVPHFYSVCGSESSRSEDESSADEDEDDPLSLSPASSASCHQVSPPQQAPPPPAPVPPPAPAPPSAPSCPLSSPGQWSVQEVSQFISSLQGCEDLAPQFLSQEIDGQALLLLKEEHLMSTMNIKLGPALKICAHINGLRD